VTQTQQSALVAAWPAVPAAAPTFHLQLPFQVVVGECISPPLEALQDKRVLLIDDNEVNRQVLGRMVQRWGMQLVEAASGQAAPTILYSQ